MPKGAGIGREVSGQMATIVDVARRAGVSTSTVSHVINKTRYVSAEVTARVYQAIEELDYKPNAVARSLRTRESRIIGVVVSDITNPFFTASVRAIEEKASEHGYSIILCDTGEDPARELRYLNILLRRQVDGIIVAPSHENAPVIESIVQAGTPVVLLDREVTSLPVDVVKCDNESGSLQAVSYLIRCGHRRIGIVAGRIDVSTGAQRLAGYKKALEQHGIGVLPELIKVGDYTFDSGYKKTQELLSLEPRPTALFVCNNQMSLGAVMAIRDAGLTIPGDVSVIGYDDSEWARLMEPPLTVVAQPVHELGTRAAEVLIRRIQGTDSVEPSLLTLPVDFRERGSCKTLRH